VRCPRCGVEFVTRSVHGIDVDVCERCSGMFLDHGELNRVAAPTQGDLEFSTVHGDSFEHEDGFGPAACPRCRDIEMKKVEFNIYTGIILDYCERCRGFWLDGQELERIDQEVRELNEGAAEGHEEPPMMWFARFIWALPR